MQPTGRIRVDSGLPWPLVGRSGERAHLDRAFSAAAEGRPRVVLVQSDPGMGKTVLLADFAVRIGVQGQVALTSVICDQQERDVVFGLAGLVLGEWLDAVESVLSVARRLLNWFNEQQSGGNVVLIVDDAQWMDRPSAEALRFALRRLRTDRVLTVLARRTPEAQDSWDAVLADAALTTTIELGPLTAPDVVQLLARSAGSSSGPVTADRIVRSTGGVPLLVRSVLTASQEWDTPGANLVSALSAVRQMLRGLSSQALLLVQTLAVLAVPSEPNQLAEVAGVVDTFGALSAALRTGVIAVDSSGSVDFTHALLRTAVYDQIPLRLQRDLHRRAAVRTSAGRALAHRVAAAERPDAGLVAELVAAADAARRDNQPAMAAAHLLQARSVCPEPETRDSLLLRALCDRLDGFDLRGARELEGDAGTAADSPLRSYALGLLVRDMGQPGRAGQLLGAAVNAAIAAGEDDLATRAAIELARLHAYLNDGPNVLAAVRDVRGRTDELAVQLTTIRAVGEWQSGRIATAVEMLDRLPRGPEGGVAVADRFAARGMIRYHFGDLAGATADLDYAISMSHLWRPSVMLDRAHVQRFLCRFLAGDWDAAALDASTACVLADTGEKQWVSPLAHAVAAMVPANRGDWGLAAEHLERAEDGNRRVRSTQGDGLIAAAAAQFHQAKGDHEVVLQLLAPAREPQRLARLQAVRSYRWLMIAVITALTELGRLTEAEQQLREYRAMVRRWPEAPGPARLGWLAGRLAEARADPMTASTAYAEDLADPELAKSPFTFAEILLASGGVEREFGHRREAIDRLNKARAIFLRLRAAPLIARCDDMLAQTGMRHSPAVQWGLTEREQDVAGLVAKGWTNNEIAAELYLTPKTIEYHLGNIYAKLQISGRRELRRRLSED